jgi:hypothetical protein
MPVRRPVDAILQASALRNFQKPEIVLAFWKDGGCVRVGPEDLPVGETWLRGVAAVLTDLIFSAINMPVVVL